MFEEYDEPPLKRLNVEKPMIGLAISVCLFVVGVMVGFFIACGQGGGGVLTPGRNAALFLVIGGPIAGGAGCLIWLIVAAILNAVRKGKR